MIFKIQKPLSSSNKQIYLIYNRDKSIMSQSLEVGQIKEIDDMFNKDELKVYAKGYIDRKGNLVINRKVVAQDW